MGESRREVPLRWRHDKEAFTEAADSLFWDFKNKPEILSSIKVLQLSRSTVTQCCEVTAEDLTQQLQRDVADWECFSLQLDECTDTRDTDQLCVSNWMVFTVMTEEEERLTVLPMKERTPVPFKGRPLQRRLFTHVWRSWLQRLWPLVSHRRQMA